jgi:hypothetical protein
MPFTVATLLPQKQVKSRYYAFLSVGISRDKKRDFTYEMRLLRVTKPMWRNGRRNGLKIRWALKGPCRFESGHRHFQLRIAAKQIDTIN